MALMAVSIENGHAVYAGHNEIEQDEGNRRALVTFKNLEGLFAGTAGLGLKAEPFDGLFENAALGWIVIDDQNTLGHDHANSTELTRDRLGQLPLPCSRIGHLATRRLLNSR